MKRKRLKIGSHLRNLLLKPRDKKQLGDLLKSAFDKNMIDADALMMIEGVLNVSDMQVRDIMRPRSQIDAIDVSKKPEEFIPFVIETAHTRFPVFEEVINNIIGILLAKDLLKLTSEHEFEIRDILRPPIFIPESKRLNVLLKEFRTKRNHIAIVVDEHGGVAGMVTIEDVLEQIVGDIEDEFDYDETEGNIIEENQSQFRVKAATEISDFNNFFATSYEDTDFSTIGGLVTHKFGYLPENEEKISFDGFDMTIIRSDSRQIHSIQINISEPKKNVELK